MKTGTEEAVSDWLVAQPSGTRAEYRRRIDQFERWLANAVEGLDLLDVDRGLAQRFIRWLSDDQCYADTTVQTKKSAASSFYTYAVQEGLIEHNPFEHVKVPKGRAAPKKTLTAGQVDRLLAAARDHSIMAYACVWMLVGIGLRRAEVCRARIEDIDGDQLTVMVKGRDRQVKPLYPKVAAAITEAVSDRTEGPILLNRDGNPLQPGRVNYLIDQLAGKAGIDHCAPHVLRHTCATLLLDAGVPAEDVQELLGHASIETTRGYIRNRNAAAAARRAVSHFDDILGGN